MFRETGKAGSFDGADNDKNFGAQPQMPENGDFDIKEFKQKVAALSDDATLEDVLELLGMNQFRGERPDDMG